MSLSVPQVGVLVKVVDTTLYWKKFRERLGELTPRNLDHPVPDGLVDIGGRRALIYGNPWRVLSSHPVPVLHPAHCKGNCLHRSQACRTSVYMDGAASFHSHTSTFISHVQSQSWAFLTYQKSHQVTVTFLCFVMQRLHLNDPGNKDMADTLSLLYRFAPVTGKHKKGYYSQGLPLVLFTQSWTSHRQRYVDL